jgi:cytochrome c-type biogenesis protein CcmH
MQPQFIAIVFVMIAVATAFVLVPLWSRARRTALAVAFMLPLSAIGLYAHVGSPLALDPANLAAAPTLDQEVDALAVRMHTHPDNLEGWALLGRSRKEQQRYAEALDAYAHASKLAPNEPDLMVEGAETMTLADPGHRIGDDALKLLQHAATLDPRNQRALWFLGIYSYQHEKFADAASTWEPLLTLAPEATRPALRKQIDVARAKAGMPPLPAETPAAADPALLTVRVDISPALRAKLAPTDTLFVFARAQNGPPMPLAVKRLAAKDFPQTISLADGDGPMPTMRLSQQKTVDVQARVSHAGDALPQSGDFEGAATPAAVGTKETIAITIDTIHP